MSGWTITDHVCRCCYGRVLERVEDEESVVRCADCDLEAKGAVKKICSCGTKLRSGASAGIHCLVNPEHTTGVSSKIVSEYKPDTPGTVRHAALLEEAGLDEVPDPDEYKLEMESH